MATTKNLKKSSEKKQALKAAKIFRPNPKIHKELIKQHRERILGFKEKMDQQRNWAAKIADFMTESFGTIWFFIFNATGFILWIILNSGIIKGVQLFDPYPFGMLTMVVSLEAIFLSIIVLISQNRAAHIDDLREEIDLHVNVRAEEEITKMLIILDEIHDHLGLPPEDDAELTEMKKKTNLKEIEEDLIKGNGQ